MKLVVKKEAELLSYLYENLEMQKKKVKSFLTHGDIYIDHQKVTQYNFKLLPGMVIMIHHKNNKNLLSLHLHIARGVPIWGNVAGCRHIKSVYPTLVLDGSKSGSF